LHDVRRFVLRRGVEIQDESTAFDGAARTNDARDRAWAI
jgi:hypothetical protein